MEKTWDLLTPKELRNAKIISIIFMLISLLIAIFLSEIIGIILLAIWISSGLAPFFSSSKGAIKNKIYALKIVEPGYNYWKDKEIIKQIKAIEECGYKWFEKKGRVGFKHVKTKLYLKIEGLHLYKPEEIKKTYKEVWSKDNLNQARKRNTFNETIQEAISDKFVMDVLSIGEIEKVSSYEYIKSIMTGKNRVLAFFFKEENNKIVTEKYFNQKEAIVTISNNILIITKKIKKNKLQFLLKNGRKFTIIFHFFNTDLIINIALNMKTCQKILGCILNLQDKNH